MRRIPHRMCLTVGHYEMSHHGFMNEINPNVGPHDWRVGSGTCDCDCETCLEVHGPEANGTTFYAYRYTPTGREVIKVSPMGRETITDGTEGVA